MNLDPVIKEFNKLIYNKKKFKDVIKIKRFKFIMKGKRNINVNFNININIRIFML